MTVTKEEFHKIYKEQIEPIVKPLDIEFNETMRKEAVLTSIIKKIFLFLGLGMMAAGFTFLCLSLVGFYDWEFIKSYLFLFFFFSFFCLLECWSSCVDKAKVNKYRKILKEKIIQNILSMHGNFYFSDSKNAIPLSDIKSMGFFGDQDINLKKDDDVIIGTYKGFNLLINECTLEHISNDNKTFTIFYGLILKIQVKKKFKSKTFIGPRGYIKRLWKFEPVELESIDMIKNYEVYSTDQIEARYLLTPTFIEHVLSAVKLFNIAVTKHCEFGNTDKKGCGLLLTGFFGGFIDDYIYLLVQSLEDFFDVDIDRSVPIFGAQKKNYTILGEEKYYNIYNQLSAILGIIDYLKLDKNLGL